MEIVQEDCGDGSMLCTDHPYKNNTPGGICAFCLQEKLGKLVSSSFPITIFPSCSSSSSPSFRSDNNFTTHPTSSIVPLRTHTSSSVLSNTQNECHRHNFKISKIPYLLTHKKKKKKDSSTNADHNNNAMIFKRSKSTATPRRGVHFNEIDDFGSNKRRFWSFRHSNKHLVSNKVPEMKEICYSSSACAGNMGLFAASRERSLKKEEVVIVEENDSPDQVTFDRKVSRSRSVGCGSRSFSGDLFERISTGFGDCTLRRVESQREGKSRTRRSGAGRHDTIKERVKCGGLFSGFMLTSSSSSSSSSSYWVSSSTEDNHTINANVKPTAAPAVAHGRSKSWGWPFASPMRAFNKPTSAKRDAMSAANRNLDPNLAAMPSLLAMRS